MYEAVDSRRAVRAFSDEPVSKEVLERVLAAATRAPSSGNLQPWHVYAARSTGTGAEALGRLRPIPNPQRPAA